MPSLGRARLLLPGLLVAATGVGAGDLVTASLAGSELGLAVLWAAVAGAILKVALNEGLARWQLATGTTLLEGWVVRLGGPVPVLFALYLGLWSLVVGGALISACGVAGQALLPLEDARAGRALWGAVHAVGGLMLVRRGKLAGFERVMAAAVALMVACVVPCAALLVDDWGALARGLVTPRVPEGGLGWVAGVLGGVGGTVTLLSYGYWIREHGRAGTAGLRTCRIDLGAAYALTALFGVAMITIGARLELRGEGAGVAVAIADELASVLGAPVRWLFLLGFWAAVTSSLLGVLQGVPYLAGDLAALRRGQRLDTSAITASAPYRWYQLGLALLPLPLLLHPFRWVQLAYAVAGALFMPFLAATLLLLNNRRAWVGDGFRNGWLSNTLLLLTLALFAWEGGRSLLALVGG